MSKQMSFQRLDEDGLMKTVAMDAGSNGIRANDIAPGCVEGPRIDGVIEREAVAKFTTPDIICTANKSDIPLQVFASPRDVGAIAVFLASDDSALTKRDATVMVCTVQLENTLCQIDTYNSNFRHGCLSYEDPSFCAKQEPPISILEC
jgi:hypothetical protein